MPAITKTIAADLPEGGYLEITAVERDRSGGLSPGFSITGDIWDRHGHITGRARKRLGQEQDASGCLHEEILAAAPELEPLVDIHLADPEGLPMHAKANGWYFYSGQAAAYEHRMIAAGRDYDYSRHLEVSDHNRAADALVISPQRLPTGLGRESFMDFVDSLAQHYLDRAENARQIMADLTDGQGVESVR